MFIGLFKRPYVVRHYDAQIINAGYASAKYTDTVIRLNVQPLSSNDLLVLPEGDRTIKRIKSYGTSKLMSADDYEGVPGDRLYYNGYWYECTSSVMWDHSLLSHYRSDFAIIPQNNQMSPPSKGETEP